MYPYNFSMISPLFSHAYPNIYLDPSTSPWFSQKNTDFSCASQASSPEISMRLPCFPSSSQHVPIAFHDFPISFSALPVFFPVLFFFPSIFPTFFPAVFQGKPTGNQPLSGPTAMAAGRPPVRYLCSEELWGEDQLMEEVLASKGLLQVGKHTLWLFNIAMENGPFIDDFPIRTSIYGWFSMAMLHNKMVSKMADGNRWKMPWKMDEK